MLSPLIILYFLLYFAFLYKCLFRPQCRFHWWDSAPTIIRQSAFPFLPHLNYLLRVVRVTHCAANFKELMVFSMLSKTKERSCSFNKAKSRKYHIQASLAFFFYGAVAATQCWNQRKKKSNLCRMFYFFAYM